MSSPRVPTMVRPCPPLGRDVSVAVPSLTGHCHFTGGPEGITDWRGGAAGFAAVFGFGLTVGLAFDGTGAPFGPKLLRGTLFGAAARAGAAAEALRVGGDKRSVCPG